MTRYKSFITDKYQPRLIKPKMLQRFKRFYRWSPWPIYNLRAFTKAAKRHIRYKRYIAQRYGDNILSQYKYFQKKNFFKIKNYLSTYGLIFRAFMRRGSLVQIIHEYFYKLSIIEAALEDKNYLISRRFPRVYSPQVLQTFFSQVNSGMILSLRRMHYCLMMRKKKVTITLR